MLIVRQRLRYPFSLLSSPFLLFTFYFLLFTSYFPMGLRHFFLRATITFWEKLSLYI